MTAFVERSIIWEVLNVMKEHQSILQGLSPKRFHLLLLTENQFF